MATKAEKAAAAAAALAAQGATIDSEVKALKADAADLPESVTVANLYGYLNEETGTTHFWQEGQVVTDPEQIADLIARQVPLKA